MLRINLMLMLSSFLCMTYALQAYFCDINHIYSHSLELSSSCVRISIIEISLQLFCVPHSVLSVVYHDTSVWYSFAGCSGTYTNSLNSIKLSLVLLNLFIDCSSTHCACLSLRYSACMMSFNLLLVITMIVVMIHLLYIIISFCCCESTDCIICDLFFI